MRYHPRFDSNAWVWPTGPIEKEINNGRIVFLGFDERTMKKMKAGKAPDNLPTASRIWGELKESSSDFPTLHHLGIQRLGPKSWNLPHTSVPVSQSRLTANFVEWLMGFPIGWTDCGS